MAYPTKDAKLEIIPIKKGSAGAGHASSSPAVPAKNIKLQGHRRQKFIGFEPDIPTRKAIDVERLSE